MTYTTLVNQVLDYLNRTDDDTRNAIPYFIAQAEQRICRESKNIGLEAYVTGVFVPDEPVLAKPGRWRRSISFNCGTYGGTPNPSDINPRNQLYLRSYEFLRNYWPDANNTGRPQFYSDYGYAHLLVAPTPNVNYPFEYSYLELPEPINEDNQTNWLTDYAPDVLLYATLLEAISFLKNDERIPVWQQYYERGITSLNNQDTIRVIDRASDRSSD